MKKKPKIRQNPAKNSGLTRLLLHNQGELSTARRKIAHKKVKKDRTRKLRATKQSKPAAPPSKLTPQQLRTLQKEWYDKLRATGFTDLESFTEGYGFKPYLNNVGSQAPARIAMAWNTENETYFRRLTNYITHNPNWSGDRMYNLIGQYYIVGTSYRKMLPKLEAEGYRTNIWRVHHVVKLLVKKATEWNKSHPEGLDFEPDIGMQYELEEG